MEGEERRKKSSDQMIGILKNYRDEKFYNRPAIIIPSNIPKVVIHNDKRRGHDFLEEVVNRYESFKADLKVFQHSYDHDKTDLQNLKKLASTMIRLASTTSPGSEEYQSLPWLQGAIEKLEEVLKFDAKDHGARFQKAKAHYLVLRMNLLEDKYGDLYKHHCKQAFECFKDVQHKAPDVYGESKLLEIIPKYYPPGWDPEFFDKDKTCQNPESYPRLKQKMKKKMIQGSYHLSKKKKIQCSISLVPQLSAKMSNVKKKTKKAKLTLSSSKVGSVSSIGTTSPIEIDHEKEHVSTNPIKLEDGDNDSDDNPTDRSWVWAHFKKYKVVTEVMVDGVMTAVVKRKAKCNHCPCGDYAIGSRSNGTKTLTHHLNLRCPGFKKDKDNGQSVLTGDKGVMNNMVLRKFSQENTMTALIEMVVVDEMPFSTVDKPGFRKFCSIALPEFSIPSRRLFVREFFHLYEKYNKMLRKEIAMHRVSLTIDTWTYVQNTNYMVITAHFIDSEWKMHKRILSFGEIENHQGVTIGKAIEACLLKWNIEKISTITVDNASANLTAINWVRTSMNSWDKSKAIMEGEYLHVRCVAHIVNLIVGHGLKVLNRSVLAIRNSVSYVRSSPHRKLEFIKTAEVVKIPCKGYVVLDVPTRWNSTYLMLKSSLTFRLAFERMKDDVAYQAYFNNEELVGEFDETVDGLIAPPTIKKRVGPPVDADWEKAEVFVDFLEAFYEVTLRVSSALRPVANTCFHDIMVIENKLRDLYVPITDHATQKRTELEEILSTMSTRMTSMYEKYFGRHSDMNQMLFVALFLDPRFKLTSVAHLFAKEGISDADLKARTAKILDLVMKLYDYYKPPTADVPSQFSSSHSTLTRSTLTRTGSTETKRPKKKNLLSLLQNLPVNNNNLVFKHEVDMYLSDKLEFFNGDVELDLLNWWKLHGPKYPVLALMAKDVLAIQVSSVASESAFSTGGRIVDTSRSSLTPKSVEALLCLQDWIKGDHITTYIKDEPSIESYTFYEQCEQEISAAGSTTNAPF